MPYRRTDRFLCGSTPMVRSYWRSLVFAWTLFVLGVPALAQSGYKVEITGAGELSSLLEEHLEIRRHADDAQLRPEELQRLVDITPRQIRELLATEGYFSPRVEAQLTEEEGRNVARFRVEIGEAVRVTSVDIRFRGDIVQEEGRNAARMNRLRRQWSLDVGERFRQSAWSDAKNALLKNLLVRDYPAAAIAASEARIEPEKLSAALTVEVDSGPPFTFGELRIEGLDRYDRDMIDRLNPIKPGDPYSQEKLTELQSRLQDTGYFSSAFASVEIDAEHPNRVPVLVDVNENPSKRLGLGVGFSTDGGPRLEVKWLNRDLLDKLWRLESELLLDRKTRRIGSGLYLPPLENGWYPVLDARYERTDISGELTDKIRLGARLNSPIKTDEQSWGVAYLADRQRIGDNFLNNRHALIATYSYTWRRFDNLLSPRRGYQAAVDLGAGPPGVINAGTIARVVGSGVWLGSLGGRWQTVLRGQVGQVFGTGRVDLPGDLLFRTGGDQTVRGYAYNSLGVAQDGAVVGGTVLAVLSAELVYRLTPQWGAAVFTDAGNAADSWSSFRFARGTGVGARWRSPIGPVNVDLAYGHETRKIRLHFSVGYGF